QHLGVFIDFSPAAQGAVETASSWANAFAGGASAGPPRMSVVHVAAASAASEGADRLEAETQRSIERLTGEGDAEPGIEYTPEVLYSDEPAEEVARWARAEEVELIVLGTRGMSRLPYSYLGGFASTVARTVPCSVLLVPPEYAVA